MNHGGSHLAYLCAVLNATIIGLSFLFTKVALEYADPLDTLTYRFAVSVVVISIPAMFGRIRIRLNYSGKPLYKVFLLATMYPLIFFTFQTFGLKHTTSTEGGIIYAFTPVLTMLLAFVFLKEATTLLQKLSISLSIAGVVFIFSMKGIGLEGLNMSGIVQLLLSCLAFAGYSVLARSLLRTYTPMEISCLMIGIGFITFAAISITNHVNEGTLHLFIEPLTRGSFLFSVLYLGIMSTLITALTANYALSKLDASKMSVFSNLATVVSIAAGTLFLNEQIEVYHIVGSILIIAGVIGTNSVRLTASYKTYKNRELI